MDTTSSLELSNLTSSDLLTTPFVEGRTYELTVSWPSGKRLTYLARTAEQYDHINLVVERALDVGTDCKIRSYKSSRIENDNRETNGHNDALLIESGKLSSRALDQFRRCADELLQVEVSNLLKKDRLTQVGVSETLKKGQLEQVVDLLRPYSAYRVQALSSDKGSQVVALDFDGCLAELLPGQFSKIGEPLPGAIEAIQTLVDEGYRVVIMSTRAMSGKGKSDIQDWLDAHGAPDVTVTGHKIPASVYLDDRAVRFTDWKTSLEEIRNIVEGSDETKSASLCSFDKSILERKGADLICPACDRIVNILQTAVASVHALSPGDKVYVKALDGKTKGNAYLICKASKKEEYSLQGNDLWIVKFASGECLPVGENYLVKIGHDERIQRMAESIILGDEDRLSKVADMSVKYDLDKVVESALSEVKEGILPPDAVLVSVGSRFGLCSDDLDFVAAQLITESEEQSNKVADMTDSVRDALLEVEARFSREGRVPSEEDETNLVLGYVAEEYDLTSEAMDEDLETKVKDLILTVRSTDKRIPLWVRSEKLDEFRSKISEGFLVGLNKFRSEAMTVPTVEDYRKTKTTPMGVSELNEFYDQATEEDKEEVSGLIEDGRIQEAWSIIEKYVGRRHVKLNELQDYKPTHLPSLTSIPEGEYDTVRHQTTADEDGPALCMNCGSVWQEGIRCCDNPKKAPGEGPAMRGEVKEGYTGSECISCGKFVPLHDAVKNEYGAGYLCQTCAPEWNKDVTDKEWKETREPVTAANDEVKVTLIPFPVQDRPDMLMWEVEYNGEKSTYLFPKKYSEEDVKKTVLLEHGGAQKQAANDTSFMRGNAYVMQFLDEWEIETDDEVTNILKSNSSDEEKYNKIKERTIELIQSKPESEAQIKEVDWDAPEIKADIYSMIEESNESKKESSMKVKAADVDTIVKSYLIAALWSTTNFETEEPWDATRGVNDFSQKAEAEARRVVTEFVQKAGDLLNGLGPEQIGHDLWLTRNGHGAGFWDRGLGEAGEKLTELSQSLGEDDIYADEQNGELHFEHEASMKVSENKKILDEVVSTLKPSAEQKKVIASIYDSLDDFTPDFLKSVGQFFTYDWDQGSSWEVREVEGKKQIVRKEVLPKKAPPSGKHSFKEGQVVKSYLSFFPSDVKIVALLGEDRYRVKSTIDGTVSEVSEDDLLVDDPKKGLFN